MLIYQQHSPLIYCKVLLSIVEYAKQSWKLQEFQVSLDSSKFFVILLPTCLLTSRAYFFQDTFDVRILMAKPCCHGVNFLTTKEEDLHK